VPFAGVQVKGLDELRAAIRESGDVGLKNALAQANLDAANVVVDVATPNTPRRFGDLQHSLKALGGQKSGRAKATVPYAAAIHWGRKVGNVGRPPGNHKGPNPIVGRPFLWNAARTARRRIALQYEKDIKAIVVAAINKG
jgi:hypothetical protein